MTSSATRSGRAAFIRKYCPAAVPVEVPGGDLRGVALDAAAHTV